VTPERKGGSQTAVFVDQLFPDGFEDFTGILEIRGTTPVAAVILKHTGNSRNEPVLTTLPVADLMHPPIDRFTGVSADCHRRGILVPIRVFKYFIVSYDDGKVGLFQRQP